MNGEYVTTSDVALDSFVRCEGERLGWKSNVDSKILDVCCLHGLIHEQQELFVGGGCGWRLDYFGSRLQAETETEHFEK
jgi:hypothetical protein